LHFILYMKKLENDYYLIRRHMLQFSSVVRGPCRDYRNFYSLLPCLLPEMKTYDITSAIALSVVELVANILHN